jgi:hypothetical protein
MLVCYTDFFLLCIILGQSPPPPQVRACMLSVRYQQSGGFCFGSFTFASFNDAFSTACSVALGEMKNECKIFFGIVEGK